MTRIFRMWRQGSWPMALLLFASSVNAEDLRDWYCPYTPDGTCTPKRQTYGHFAPKWHRWPGVTAADYESKRPPQEPTPPAATETPGLPPAELLLPPTNFPRDDAPAPPGGAGQPQPLTPEARPTPDILSPPGEDVMDELLPDVEPPAKPSQQPATPSKPSTPPSDEADIPFPEAEDSADPAPAPTNAAPGKPEPAAPKSSTPSDGEDPFKDDPFFNDAAPAPGESRQPNRLDRQLELPSEPVPATHEAPMRLPAAELGRVPRSRLSRNSGSAQPTPAAPRPDYSRAAPRGNPLRPGTPAISFNDDRVVPTAAWQAEADVESPAESAHNPLR